jgi:hypothetical protein
LNAPNVNSAPEKAPIILPKTPLGTAKKGVSFPGEISLMQSALSLLHESPEKIEVIKKTPISLIKDLTEAKFNLFLSWNNAITQKNFFMMFAISQLFNRRSAQPAIESPVAYEPS